MIYYVFESSLPYLLTPWKGKKESAETNSPYNKHYVLTIRSLILFGIIFLLRRFQRNAIYGLTFGLVSQRCINLRGLHVLVGEHLLHHIYVRASLHLQRTEGVSGAVECDVLGDASRQHANKSPKSRFFLISMGAKLHFSIFLRLQNYTFSANYIATNILFPQNKKIYKWSELTKSAD